MSSTGKKNVQNRAWRLRTIICSVGPQEVGEGSHHPRPAADGGASAARRRLGSSSSSSPSEWPVMLEEDVFEVGALDVEVLDAPVALGGAVEQRDDGALRADRRRAT